MKTRKRGDAFWKVFLIILLVVVILVGAGLFGFWKYLEAYESTLPDTVITAYIADKGTDYWVTGVRDAALAGNGEFAYEYTEEDVPDITSLIAKGYDTREQTAEKTDSKSVHIVSAGGTDIAKLTLKPTGEATFGFQYWAVDEVEFLTGNEQSVSLVAPKDAVVAINGVEVGESYIDSEDFTYDVEPEEPFDKAPTGVVYKVDGIRGKIDVTVTTESGEELTGESKDGRLQYMPLPSSLYVIADKDTKVLANDVELTDDHMTVYTDSELCKGFAEYMPDCPLVVYACDELCSVPVLTAKAGAKTIEGRELLNGGMDFTTADAAELEESQKAFIEEFSKRYIDFSTNQGDDTVGTYTALIAYVLGGSELATRLEGSIEPMSWVDGATVKYNDLRIGDFISLGENAYVCSISYSLINSTNYEDRDVAVTYELLVVRTGTTWLVANMLADR